MDELAELVEVPSMDQIISTAASARASTSGLKRGLFGCKNNQLPFCF